MASQRPNCWLLILLKFLMCITRVPGTDESNTDFTLPKDWHTLCPYTDICHHKASKTITLPGSKKPCCDSCSCDDDCGLHRNCCQYSMDKYRIDEKYETNCISLLVRGKHSSIYDSYLYNAVDRCPNKKSCYEFNVAKWGSMYPVSSTDTKTIFLNEECALCNGVHNVTQWETEMSCESDKSGDVYISDALRNYLDGVLESGICRIGFLPPSNLDHKYQHCTFYPKIGYCRYPNISDSETQMLCESYNATYYYLTTSFANIHCYLCSSKVQVNHVCGTKDTNRLQTASFTFVLSSTQLSGLKTTGDTKECRGNCKCEQNEVAETRSGLCRQVRCPVAMLEVNGKCAYLTDEWTAGPFYTMLKLQLLNKELTIDRNELEEHALLHPKLFPHKLKSWKKDYYIPDESSTKVEYLITRLHHRRKKVNIASFLNNFKVAVESTWTLVMKEKKYTMKADLHQFFDYVTCNVSGGLRYISRDNKPNIIDDCVTLEKSEEEMLVPLQNDNTDIGEWTIPLTKFYFCKQIDLRKEEYDTYAQGNQILFKGTKYARREYRKIVSRGEEKIALCMSDFGKDFWLSSDSHKVFFIGDLGAKQLLFLYVLIYIVQ